MDEAKNGTVPLISNGGQDVAISMDGVLGDKQRYQQQLQLIDEQVRLSAFLPVVRQVLYGGTEAVQVTPLRRTLASSP